MPDLSATSIGIELGGGAVIGAVTGFAAKKIAKAIAILVGIQLALFKLLESRGLITVDWDALTAGLVGITNAARSPTPPPWLHSIVSTFAVSAGFVGGFAVGFKQG